MQHEQQIYIHAYLKDNKYRHLYNVIHFLTHWTLSPSGGSLGLYTRRPLLLMTSVSSASATLALIAKVPPTGLARFLANGYNKMSKPRVSS